MADTAAPPRPLLFPEVSQFKVMSRPALPPDNPEIAGLERLLARAWRQLPTETQEALTAAWGGPVRVELGGPPLPVATGDVLASYRPGEGFWFSAVLLQLPEEDGLLVVAHELAHAMCCLRGVEGDQEDAANELAVSWGFPGRPTAPFEFSTAATEAAGGRWPELCRRVYEKLPAHVRARLHDRPLSVELSVQHPTRPSPPGELATFDPAGSPSLWFSTALLDRADAFAEAAVAHELAHAYLAAGRSPAPHSVPPWRRVHEENAVNQLLKVWGFAGGR